MKTKLLLVGMSVYLILAFTFTGVSAQDEEKTSPFSLGADFVSSYVWRGSKVGKGPNIQPYVKFVTGGLTVGSWGSYSFHDFGDFAETDLYVSYGFDFGLSLGITDYYYQGFPLFSLEGDSGSHAFEINAAYAMEKLSIAANYIVNDASNGGPANNPGGGDMYFELGYNFENFGVFLGAGNGWHTADNDKGEDVFGVCNIGIKTSKELKVSDTFSIPVSGALIVNPDREELNLVLGFSF
jgi:hypothetical protein